MVNGDALQCLPAADAQVIGQVLEREPAQPMYALATGMGASAAARGLVQGIAKAA